MCNFSGFPVFLDFPDPESGKPDFWVVPVNQLEKSFEMIGHMTFSPFSGFPDPETVFLDLLLPWSDPGVKPDPTVPHMWP